MFKTISTFAILSVMLIAAVQPKPKTGAKKQAKTATSKTAAAKPGPVTFTLSGRLQGYNNHLIVLSTFRATDMVLLDSVRTDSAGRFFLKKTVPANCIGYLQYTKNTAVPLIIENGAAFNIEINPMLNGLNYEITGTKTEKSQNIYNFIKKFSALSGELGQLEQLIANEPDAIKSYEAQLNFSVKQQELRSHIDNMVTNNSPLEAYFVMFNFMEEQKVSDVKTIMNKMELARDTKNEYYTDLKYIYDNNKSLEVGELAPDIDLPQPNGGANLKLSSLRGKVVLIDFWASWCGPCRAEFPNVKRIYTKYKDKGFEIYGVSLDKDAASWTGSITSLGLNWKHVSDLKYWSAAPAKVYKVTGIPYTVLVGKDGKIIAKNLRGEELERKLEELFP